MTPQVIEEIEKFFKAELVDKPLDIKTDDMTADEIALEVRSSQIAIKKIYRLLSRLKGIEPKDSKSESWK